jgi:hypothetical protein
VRVNNLGTRLVSAAVLTVSVLVTFATPAGATTVVADDTYKWFYWIGPVLALSFVGWLVLMAVGYYVKVLRPKWRGQKPA